VTRAQRGSPRASPTIDALHRPSTAGAARTAGQIRRAPRPWLLLRQASRKRRRRPGSPSDWNKLRASIGPSAASAPSPLGHSRSDCRSSPTSDAGMRSEPAAQATWDRAGYLCSCQAEAPLRSLHMHGRRSGARRARLVSATRRADDSGAVCSAQKNLGAAGRPFKSAAAAPGLIQLVVAAP
jgi:hypothetical protein